MTATLPVPTAGDSAYRVRALGAGGGVDPTTQSDASNVVTVAGTPAVVSGVATSSLAFTDSDTDKLLSSGDKVVVTFASSVAAGSAASITLSNDQGQSSTITRGTATADFSVAGAVVTVTLNSAPTVSDSTPFAADGAANALELTGVTGVTSASDASTVPNLVRAAATTRTAGVVALLPAAPASASGSSASDTVKANVGAGLQARVYNETGTKLLATSPKNSTGAATDITFGAGSDLVAGQHLLVAQYDPATGLESGGVDVTVG
jgi:hypothetical protein